MYMEKFDLIIIGAGPAGLSASVYASRYGIKHVVLGEVTGGLLTQTFEIGNWLGTENITGQEFANQSAAHVKSYGVEILPVTVVSLAKNDGGFLVTLADGNALWAKTVLSATGTRHRHLGVPGEVELSGKGVSYCPTCDGFFFRNKTVCVVGGGDSAATAGVYLADVCRKVYMIVREREMIAEKFWQDVLAKKPNVEILYTANVKKINGEHRVESVLLDRIHQESDRLVTDGVFIEIGLLPNTNFLTSLGVELDAYGYVKVMPDQSTVVKGVWAAGDATTGSNSFRQIVTAASEGAIAANSILQYLQKSGGDTLA